MRLTATRQPSSGHVAKKAPLDRDVLSSRRPNPLRFGATGVSLIQRKPGCACGGGCPRCKGDPGIQTKLRISEPGDEYEREADRVADQVLGMPEPAVRGLIDNEDEEEELIQTKPLITPLAQRQIGEEQQELLQAKSIDDQTSPLVQRHDEEATQGNFIQRCQNGQLCALCMRGECSHHGRVKSPAEVLQRQSVEEEEETIQTKDVSGGSPQFTPTLGSQVDALRGSWQPLPESVRAFFAPRFGYDFSKVRVRADEKAAESAQALNALAYTVGQNVVFGAGLYAPQTKAGRRLLAHELTHTIQQSMADVSAPTRQKLTTPQAQFEQETDTAAVESGRSVPAISAQAVQVARDELDAGVEEPYRNQQLECVRQLGGCPETRPAGIPTEAELKDYNRECREETGYGGSDIFPTGDECTLATLAAVSVELPGAPGGPTPEARVAGWLRKHQPTIARTETSYSVDRRAIAGAIAWEALENPRAWFGFGFARFRGPGKVHYKEGHIFEGEPVAKQVEEAGYLPKVTKEERERLLSTATASIAYIGAIMKAFADVAASAGYYLNCDPPMLTTFYNAWDLNGATELFKKKKAPDKLTANDQMGQWVEKNEPYLVGAVGRPAGALCNPPRGY